MNRRQFFQWLGVAPVVAALPVGKASEEKTNGLTTSGDVDLGTGVKGAPHWHWLNNKCAIVHTDFIVPELGADAVLTVNDWPEWYQQVQSYRSQIFDGKRELVKMRVACRDDKGNLGILDCIGLVWLDESYGDGGFDAVTKTQQYIFRRSNLVGEGMAPVGTVISTGALVIGNEVQIGRVYTS